MACVDVVLHASHVLLELFLYLFPIHLLRVEGVWVCVCVCDVILEYYFQFYKFRGQGGGECDFSSFTLFTFLFHKFYGEGGGDANPLSLHSRSALDSDESLND